MNDPETILEKGYDPFKPPVKLTIRQQIGAAWFYVKHYVFDMPLPCRNCRYSLNTAMFQQQDDPPSYAREVCLNPHIIKFYDNKTPTTEKARNGACGRQPTVFSHPVDHHAIRKILHQKTTRPGIKRQDQ